LEKLGSLSKFAMHTLYQKLRSLSDFKNIFTLKVLCKNELYTSSVPSSISLSYIISKIKSKFPSDSMVLLMILNECKSYDDIATLVWKLITSQNCQHPQILCGIELLLLVSAEKRDPYNSKGPSSIGNTFGTLIKLLLIE
jgi:hypothetical protein